MDSVALFLIAIAGIFLIGALGEIVFQRTNIPDVIWLIAAGIILGPVLGLITRDQLGRIAPYFAALTLIVVLFEGGSRLRLDELSRAAPRSTLLAIATFAFSVGAMMLVSMGAKLAGLLPESWTWTHGLLLGTILGGPSSIIIMPAMASAKVNPSVANLVALESALTDAFCVVGSMALIDIMVSGSTGVQAPMITLGKSFGVGLGIGLIAGMFWILFLRVLRSSEHAYPVTLSALLVLYVLISHAGGSAALGILTCAVILGNAPVISKKIGMAEPLGLGRDVRGFHRQMAFIIKSFFFTFIGLMIGPPWALLALGALLGLILFGARIPGVYAATVASSLTKPSKKLVSVSLPRGMAAGVLATMPFYAGVPGTENLPVIVFSCVLVTILVFAVGFPLVKRKMVPFDLPLPDSLRDPFVSDLPQAGVGPPVPGTPRIEILPNGTQPLDGTEAAPGATAPQAARPLPPPAPPPAQRAPPPSPQIQAPPPPPGSTSRDPNRGSG